MSLTTIIIASLAYILLLFLVAFWGARSAERGGRWVNNPYTYALSLAVYCTAWTFFGSVGRAAESGIAFLPIYLGPAILAPVWLIFLRKIIRISKAERITSIADFISARYGKSSFLGAWAAIIAVLGVIPYISIQLKAVTLSFDVLLGDLNIAAFKMGAGQDFYLDAAFYVAILLAFFTFMFGARKLDPNERHEGLVAAIAFESLVKLGAFLAVGIFVVYGAFDGFGDLMTKAASSETVSRIFDFQQTGTDGTHWFWLITLSMFAMILLPRQFHIAIVENTDDRYVNKAAWLFPLYLLLINVFVLPIAIGGLLIFPDAGIDADTFILSLPLAFDQELLALLVFIGGLSAATGMVIVSVNALSIMISNHLVMPYLLRASLLNDQVPDDLPPRLLGIRRVIIVVVLILAYGYFRGFAMRYSIVSIGLVSFTAVAQFAPVVIGSLYWKRGTKIAAISALIVGFFMWFYTLIVPLMEEQLLISTAIANEGPFGLRFLRPHALFGLEGMDQISHAAFWSLLFNSLTFLLVSVNTKQSALEIAQADFFVNFHKYSKGAPEYEMLNRQANFTELKALLERFLGKKRAIALLYEYGQEHSLNISELRIADTALVNYTERHIAGALGAPSAKLIISSVCNEEPIALAEMLKVLDQTHEIIQYSKALEQKKIELEKTTQQLQASNEQLKELDELKAEFISTVTHELRTPITSIKAIGKILYDNPNLPEEQKEEFLSIIVKESERIARLVTEVLDLQKVQSQYEQWTFKKEDINQLAQDAFKATKQLMKEHNYEAQFTPYSEALYIQVEKDKVVQMIVNLLSNAIKFCDDEKGKVSLEVKKQKETVDIIVRDNGLGIAAENQQKIFEKFVQVKSEGHTKPRGTGLGLYISKQIAEKHKGDISVASALGEGTAFTISLPLLS